MAQTSLYEFFLGWRVRPKRCQAKGSAKCTTIVKNTVPTVTQPTATWALYDLTSCGGGRACQQVQSRRGGVRRLTCRKLEELR